MAITTTVSAQPAAASPARDVQHLQPDADRYIATSPYPDHLLDLDTLDPQTRLLARALSVFDATRSDYATAPYVDSFNVSDVVGELRRHVAAAAHAQNGDVPATTTTTTTPTTTATPWTASSYFVVAFRSQIPPSTRSPARTALLDRLDEAAHAEANASSGLLRYWFGAPDADGRNLATCVWRSPADARRAGHGTQHRRAASEVQSLYREWRIERYRLVLRDDLASWDVVAWEDEEEGAETKRRGPEV